MCLALHAALSDLRSEDRPAAQDNEAIIHAAQYGHIDVVKLLLTYEQVDPTAQNNKAINEAVLWGHSDVVKLLLTYERVGVSSAAHAALSDHPAARDNKAIN